MKRLVPFKKAFTLIEVMVSLLILCISTISVLTLSLFSAKVGRQSEARATALSIARTKMDEVLSVSQLNRVPVTDKEIALSTQIANQLPGTGTTASYSILPVSGSKNLQKLSVSVRWKNPSSGGAETTVTVSKIVSSTINASKLKNDGWTPKPIDQLFYSPPPPKPIVPTTTGGSSTTGSSSTGGSSTTGSSSSTGSTGGRTSGGSSSTSGTTTGGSSSSTTATTPPVSGFNPGNGNKWK